MSDAAICLALTQAISRTRKAEDIYEAALDALRDGLGIERASILLFDSDDVMRFKAWRGLSEAYRRAVEGHAPWTPTSPHPQPIVVADVTSDPGLAPYLETIRAEGIAAMAFVPLVSMDRVIGKFMLYSATPRHLSAGRAHAGRHRCGAGRLRGRQDPRRRGRPLFRGAPPLRARSRDDGHVGLGSGDEHRPWSENLERVHGLQPGTFDGSFASYERRSS